MEDTPKPHPGNGGTPGGEPPHKPGLRGLLDALVCTAYDKLAEWAPKVFSWIKVEAKALKRGWVLFSVLLVIVGLFVRWGVSAWKDSQYSEVINEKENRLQSLLDENRTLSRDRDDYRQEVDKLETKLAIGESRASLPVQTNSPLDKRLENLLQAVDRAFPNESIFDLTVNGVLITNINPTSVPIKGTALQLAVKNTGQLAAENVTISIAGTFFETNIIAIGWRPSGQWGVVKGNKWEGIGIPVFDTASVRSVAAGHGWGAPPVIFTNLSTFFLPINVEVHSDRSGTHKFYPIIIFNSVSK